MKMLELPIKQRSKVPKNDKRPKKEPRYHVLLYNDDFNTIQFVVAVLLRVLNCTFEQAVQMMAEAHNTGQAIIYTGSLTQAELVRDKILGHSPDSQSPADCEPTRLIASIQKAPD